MAQYTSPKTKAQIIVLKKLKYSDWAVVQLLQPETQVSHATQCQICCFGPSPEQSNNSSKH
ncbi:hypothetical protein RhiXN_02502 [Rhizoctonia solani]|uniref:Uncharacterized protein n=1 Tax=Rhizoctonia solani TaxID=456999 RepID=A0A8H8SUY2_9AGAM|nr:uncharacterized protein RhiXN_02502 [Rhizoctonia solani]QRW17578.1 hypothetical protein RhiXN_02502 [Rhizoctonia solani]